MNKPDLSLHEDLLGLFCRTLSEGAIEGIFAFQKRVVESFGFGGFSCVMWQDKSRSPKYVFEDCKIKIEEASLDRFQDAFKGLTDDMSAPRYVKKDFDDYLLLPILKNGSLVGFYLLALPNKEKIIPPPSFSQSMATIGLQIYFRLLNDDSFRLDRFFKLGLDDYCLNSKQRQILELVYKGETNKGIGQKVHLGEQGVKYHITSLLNKFKVSNRYALKEKVLELSKNPKRS